MKNKSKHESRNKQIKNILKTKNNNNDYSYTNINVMLIYNVIK